MRGLLNVIWQDNAATAAEMYSTEKCTFRAELKSLTVLRQAEHAWLAVVNDVELKCLPTVSFWLCGTRSR